MPSDMWVLRLSQTTRHGAAGEAEANRSFMNATKSSSVRISPMVPRTVPFATSNAAIRALVPCRTTRTRAARRVPTSLAAFWRLV